MHKSKCSIRANDCPLMPNNSHLCLRGKPVHWLDSGVVSEVFVLWDINHKDLHCVAEGQLVQKQIDILLLFYWLVIRWIRMRLICY